MITQNNEVRIVVKDPQNGEDMKNAISLMKLHFFTEEDIKNGNHVFHTVEEFLNRE